MRVAIGVASILLGLALGMLWMLFGKDPAVPPETPRSQTESAPALKADAEGPSQGGTVSETERPGEDWAEFLGPRGNGVSGETGLLAKWPAAGPPVLWKKKIGEGYAAPSVRGNRLVFFHRPQLPQAQSGPEEVVECVQADTGQSLWRFAYRTTFQDPYGYNGGPRCTPLLTADRCYTFGAEGILTCLALDTGKRVWQRDTGEEFDVPQAFFGVGATPILEGNLLIVALGAHPKAGVVAFDAATGETVWQNVGPADFPPPTARHQLDRPPAKLASYSAPLAVTIHGQRQALCFMRPGLISVDAKTGEPNFAFWFRSQIHDSVNAARPVVVGDEIFLSAAYETGAALLKVHADGKGFDTVWKDVDAMQNHWSTSIAHDGYLYGFSGRHQFGSTFRCIEMKSGKLMWQTEPDDGDDEHDAGGGQPRSKSYGRGSAVLAEGKFIVQGETGTLALVELDPTKFREISRVRFPELGFPSWTAPVLSRKRLYLSGARGVEGPGGRRGYEYHLLCLDLARE